MTSEKPTVRQLVIGHKSVPDDIRRWLDEYTPLEVVVLDHKSEPALRCIEMVQAQGLMIQY
jgi:hypothetical protein